MRDRLKVLIELRNHAHYGPLLRRIKESEFDLIVAFIEDNANLGKGPFEFSVNRMFVCGEKPKNWTLIMEILCVVNSLAFEQTVAS